LSAPDLTQHQQDALRALLALRETELVVSLRGLAGTGKTTLISHIANALGKTTVAAMTHRAAGILRAKGVAGAMTLHRACLRPVFDERYLALVAWIDDPTGAFPAVLRTMDQDRALDILAQNSHGVGDACVRALGVNPNDHILEWESRGHVGGTLIIDEASMATVKNVVAALNAFDDVILVGDHGQLPPVKGEPALELAAGVELTEIHRQASCSPVLTLAHDIRHGVPLYKAGVSIEIGVDPDAGPIIAWRNQSRIDLSMSTRRLKDLPANRLKPGEPLICRATEPEHRRRGFGNNMPCVFLGGDLVRFDDGRRVHAANMKVEEFNRRDQRPNDVSFRLGYSLTAHSAQGSEWQRVQIYYDDVRAMHGKGPDFCAKWLYTAVTRAKSSVRFFAVPGAGRRSAA
jgi:exodeoxyribonuclease-5